MSNDNHEVARDEHKRFERVTTARQRQVSYRLRRDGFKRASGWLSKNVGVPLASAMQDNYRIVSHRLIVLYRRASTRAAGLVLNTLENLWNMAPGRST